MAMAAASSSSSSTAPSSSICARTLLSHSLSKISSQRSHVSFPFPGPSCRLRLASTSLSAWQHRPSFIHRAAQAEAKVLDEQQDTDASGSDHESSDEENNGMATEEVQLLGVELMLKKYREALTNNDEDGLKELDLKFEELDKERATYAKQVSTLNEEVFSLKERLLRSNADFDNFRKRSERERINVSTNVKGDVVNSLLPMVDNFERAKTQIKVETEGEHRIDSSYQGIYKQFVEIMKGLGVSVVGTVGKKFDPNVHDAIMREESSVYAEGVVMEEFRRGFILGDKLLRPSMVKVSSGPPPAAPPSTPDAAATDEGAPELVEEAAE